MRAPTLINGHQIGPYRIVSYLGSGGMAEVFVGEHVDPLLARRVAMKVLRRELCQERSLVERFVNEARALGRIRHPGVVDLFEVDQLPDGRVCLIMELLRGEPLSELIAARGRVAVHDALAIAAQIASAMEAAHRQRIIHRDLKPDNVFVSLGPEGLRVRVLDFGVAKLLDDAGDVHTATSTTLGTAAYMAPEQFRSARDVDQRVDVYALGCVLFEMLTGAPPYPSRHFAQQMAGHAFAEIPLVSDVVGVPPVLDTVLARMLAKTPDERFPSMSEVLTALSAVSRDPAASGEATTLSPMNPTLIVDDFTDDDTTVARTARPKDFVGDPIANVQTLVNAPAFAPLEISGERTPIARPSRTALARPPMVPPAAATSPSVITDLVPRSPLPAQRWLPVLAVVVGVAVAVAVALALR